MGEIESAGQLAVNSLLEQSIDALTMSDVSRLKSLLRIAEEIKTSGQPDMKLDESGVRLFSSFLAETSRNLRLLKRVYVQAGMVNAHPWRES